MSPRAAGDSNFYVWLLNGDAKLPKIELPSVTYILSSVFGAPQYVVDWAANNFKNKDEMKEYRDRRSEEGTAAHEFAEKQIKSGFLTPTPETGFDKAFMRFMSERNPTFVESESVVFSLKNGYAGTTDAVILERGGSVRVVDFKTRKKTVYQAYQSDKLQCAAYYLAAVEMGLISKQPNPQIGVLLLKENARYTWVETDAPVDAWLRTLDLWHELEAIK